MLKRDYESHKGENGRILVVGGNETFVGAPLLTAMAAMRTGVDLALITTPERTAYAINSMTPDIITIKLSGKAFQPSHYPIIMEQAEQSDVVVIGPGLGQSTRTAEAIKKVCESIKAPKVIDADALKAIEEIPENCVLTPHKQEFKTLFKKEPTEENVGALAKEDQVILLKGYIDIISNGLEIRTNHTGNAGMTVGGTGDVLAGVIAGLIAQKMPLFEAACAGAEINGKAGDLLFEKHGYSFVASDLLSVIPELV